MSGFLNKIGSSCGQLLRGQPHMGGSEGSCHCFDNVITASSNFDCYPDTPMRQHRVIFLLS
jgi:hypothetical protein